MPRLDEISRIRAAVLHQRGERAGEIADGKFKTFEAYRENVGYVAGLDFAIEQITKITGSDGED